MKTFEFTSPDGKTYEITGPDNATREQAFQKLQQQLSKSQQERPAFTGVPPDGVALPAGMVAATGAASDPRNIPAIVKRGLQDIPEATGQMLLDMAAMDTKGLPDLIPPQIREKAREISPGFQSQMMAGRKEFEESPAGMDPLAPGLRAGTQIGASMLLPASKAVSTFKQALGAIPIGFGFGFAGAREEATPEERLAGRLESGKTGAMVAPLVPIGIKAATVAPKAIAHPIKTGVAVINQGKIVGQKFKDTSKFLSEHGIKSGTIGQKSGSPFLVELEATLRGGNDAKVAEQINKTNKEIVSAVKRSVGKKRTRDISLDELGATVSTTGKKAVSSLNEVRIAEFGRDMNKLEKIGGPGIKMSNLENYFRGGDKPRLGATSFRNTVKNELDDLLEMSGGTGQIKPRDLQELMSELSKATVGKGKLWKDLERSTRREFAIEAISAINKDIDAAIASGKGGVAASILRRARERYASNSEPINEIQASIIGKILDDPGVTVSGTGQIDYRSIGDKLNKMSSNVAKRTIRILNKYDRSVSQKVVEARIDNALGKALTPVEGKNVTQFKFKTFEEKLGDEKSLRALMGDTKYARLEKAIEAGKIIDPIVIGRGREAFGAAAAAAGTIVSGSPTFLAINAFRILGPLGLRRALTTQQGVNAIQKIARSIRNPRSVSPAEMNAVVRTLEIIKEESNGNQVQQ